MFGLKTYALLLLSALLIGGAFYPAGGQNAATANAPVLHATFDKDSVGIGDEFHLRVEISKDIVQQIGFPEFDDHKLGGVIEILSESAADTVKKEGRRITLAKTYRLISFDEGYYSMGKFPMLWSDKNIVDTLWSSDSLLLKVGTYEIDTTKQTIYDIKAPVGVPFRFGEVSGYLLGFLLLLGLLAVGIWLFYKYRSKLPIFSGPKPALPPHVVAIRELEALHNQKVWQNNKHKLYYTRLTDIMRTYLQGRYGIRAMEMTSDEILDAVRPLELTDKDRDALTALLNTSDLVKFAKHTPEAEENENAYQSAYYFVEDTKEQTETAIENPDTPVELLSPQAPAQQSAESGATPPPVPPVPDKKEDKP